jgi:hypothetical protein
VPSRNRIRTIQIDCAAASGGGRQLVISGNPFKAIGKGGDSLDSLLASLRVQHHDKAILFVHVACPTVQYIDRGKAAMVVGGEGQFADEEDTFDDRVAP